ncbi:MAG: hypothetical protein PHU42_01900 [Patescibacteria group bacterium]|nr:hypothetical protein [Patescibacteria group bacterium]
MGELVNCLRKASGNVDRILEVLNWVDQAMVVDKTQKRIAERIVLSTALICIKTLDEFNRVKKAIEERSFADEMASRIKTAEPLKFPTL